MAQQEMDRLALLERDDPAVHKLKQIDGIVFPNQTEIWSPSLLSLKALFQPEKMDRYHVDCVVLKKIALHVISLMEQIEACGIYPGLWDLEDFKVNMEHEDYPVLLFHPDRFQLLDQAQDYEWYPEDERLFEDEWFDAKSQLVADNRLIYKILISATKGNIKIPPKRSLADYSNIFYGTLPERWREHFEQGDAWSHAKMRQYLMEEIALEEQAGKATKKNRAEEDRQDLLNRGQQGETRAGDMLENAINAPDVFQSAISEKKNQAIRAVLYLILRTELDDCKEMSKRLYVLMDQIEEDGRLKGQALEQAFVYGDKVVMAHDFLSYKEGFRCQLEGCIKEYSSGEALLIGADLMKKRMQKAQDTERNPVQNKGVEQNERPAGQAMKTQFAIYLLCEGRLKNDHLFQIGLEHLKQTKQSGAELFLVKKKGSQGEAVEQLEKIAEIWRG